MTRCRLAEEPDAAEFFADVRFDAVDAGPEQFLPLQAATRGQVPIRTVPRASSCMSTGVRRDWRTLSQSLFRCTSLQVARRVLNLVLAGTAVLPQSHRATAAGVKGSHPLTAGGTP